MLQKNKAETDLQRDRVHQGGGWGAWGRSGVGAAPRGSPLRLAVTLLTPPSFSPGGGDGGDAGGDDDYKQVDYDDLSRSSQISRDGSDEADGDHDIDSDYVDYDNLTSATGLDIGGGGGYMPGE